MNSQAIAIRRISKDLKELQNNPLDGVGLCLVNDNDFFKMLLNIEIQVGRYTGLVVHMELELPLNYPCKAPRILIFPGQCYNEQFHHHIYPKENGYYKFCINLLDEAIMDSTEAGTGWSPGYTLSALFMQMQNFLADPDFSCRSKELSNKQVETIRQKMNNYSFPHKVNGTQVIHTHQQPFPALAKSIKQLEEPIQNSKGSIEEIVGQRLQCFLTKENIFSNPDEVFGYPIFVTQDKFQRLISTVIPEILSFSAYNTQFNGQFDLNISLKTGMGSMYNSFLPIYLNEKHFEQTLKIIERQLALISSEKTLKGMILNVLPNLINKLLVALLKGDTHVSVAAIEAYVHFTQLFHRLTEKIPALKADIETKVVNFAKSEVGRSKKICGDIGEFLVILSASKFERTTELMDLLYRELFARSVAWINSTNLQRNPEGEKRLDEVFSSGLIGSKLLVFSIEAARRFVDNPEVMKNLAETSCSVLPTEQAEKFVKSTMMIVESIKTHTMLMEYIGLGKFYPNQKSCYNLFKSAIYLSNNQNYTRNANLSLNLVGGKKFNAADLNIQDYRVNDLDHSKLKVKECFLKALDNQQKGEDKQQNKKRPDYYSNEYAGLSAIVDQKKQTSPNRLR